MKKLEMKAKELAEKPYSTDIMEDETTDGGHVYLLAHPELPGCMAQGISIDEAEKNLKEVTIEYILSLLEDDLPVPPPRTYATITTSRFSQANVQEFNAHPQQQYNFLDDLSRTTKPSNRHKIATVELITV
ncbi:MAG: type II toxin-antitoxin system HicB family antitoxin [Dehalococcoidia bacterium]|jgi:predicted RNase H-like HicB family nuclease